MRFRIDSKTDDGLAQAPAYEADFDDLDGLLAAIADELVDDAGRLPGPGTTLTVERVD